MTQAHAIAYGEKSFAFVVASNQDIDKHKDTEDVYMCWHVELQPSVCTNLDKTEQQEAIMVQTWGHVVRPKIGELCQAASRCISWYQT